jgi:Arc/MetJ family transcription regulator
MSWTGIDLDDELVACVAEALGTSTTTETVNMALRAPLGPRSLAQAAIVSWSARPLTGGRR